MLFQVRLTAFNLNRSHLEMVSLYVICFFKYLGVYYDPLRLLKEDELHQGLQIHLQNFITPLYFSKIELRFKASLQSHPV